MPVIRRTVIVTCGETAAAAVALFLTRCKQEHVPQDVLSVLDAATVTDEAKLLGAIHQVAAVQARQKLLQQGWKVAAAQEIDLYVLCDMTCDPSTADMVRMRVSEAVYQQLGVGLSAQLLWISPPDTAAQQSEHCLHTSEAHLSHWDKGVYAIGMTNEQGLHLPAIEALTKKVALVLYTVIATPIGASVDQQLRQYPLMLLGSMGVAQWGWSPDVLRQRLAHVWQKRVIALWLQRMNDDAKAHDKSEQAYRWRETAALTLDALRQQLMAHLANEAVWQQYQPRSPVAQVWHYPLPWQMRLRWQKTTAVHHLAAMQPTIEAATQAVATTMKETLWAHSQASLDASPVGGIAQLQHTMTVLQRCAVQDEDEIALSLVGVDEQIAAVSAEYEQLSTAWDANIETYPKPTVGGWLSQVWRLPFLWLRWQRLAALGGRVQRLAFRRHELTVHRHLLVAQQQLCRAIATVCKQIASHTEEIGEMLQAQQSDLCAEIQVGQIVESEGEDMSVSAPVLAQLYALGQFDDAREAAIAAATIGGLGSQLMALDDAVLAGLRPAAADRLGWIDDLTCFDVLGVLYPTVASQKMWWATWLETAAPLWRCDMTQLNETIRQTSDIVQWVSGIEATETEAWQEAGQRRALYVTDRQRTRLTVLNVRHGLSAGAMARLPTAVPSPVAPTGMWMQGESAGRENGEENDGSEFVDNVNFNDRPDQGHQ